MANPKVIPHKESGDTKHSLAKAGLAAIPIVGGSASELFNLIIAPPLAKRRDEWLESLAEGLRLLEDKLNSFSMASLKDNEDFVSAVLHATRIALLTRQAEKRDTLRSAILNVAADQAPKEGVNSLFLHLVDTLSMWHFRALSSLRTQSPNTSKTLFVEYDLVEILPEQLAPQALGKKIITDLVGAGLAHEAGDRLLITGFGKEFLKFITSPIDPVAP